MEPKTSVDGWVLLSSGDFFAPLFLLLNEVQVIVVQTEEKVGYLVLDRTTTI